MKKYLILFLSLSLGGILMPQTAKCYTPIALYALPQIDTSSGLRPGGQMPDLTIHHLINYPGPSIKISDLKGKLLILDFWATWCSPCVAMIPKMEALQKEFAGKMQFLPVTYQPEQEVSAFMTRLATQRHLDGSLPEAVGDTTLNKLFPHTYLPHYVWISGDGTVLAITGYEEVNSENISKVLAGEVLQVAEKKDPVAIPYDYHLPFLMNNNGGKGQNLIYHSLLTSYTEGLEGGISQFPPDSVRGMMISLVNVPLISLFETAYGERKVHFGANRVTLRLKDTSGITCSLSGPPYLDWLKQGHGYCYELLVPPAMASQAYQIMQSDLARFFGRYKVRIVARNQDCLVLKRTSAADKLHTAGGKAAARFDGTGCTLQNWPLNYLVTQLNVVYLQRSKYPVLNETGYEAYVDMTLEGSLSDVPSLNRALKRYDLELVKARRRVEVLDISDK